MPDLSLDGNNFSLIQYVQSSIYLKHVVQHAIGLPCRPSASIITSVTNRYVIRNIEYDPVFVILSVGAAASQVRSSNDSVKTGGILVSDMLT